MSEAGDILKHEPITDKELAEIKVRWSCEFGQFLGHRLVVDQAPMRLLIGRFIAEIERQRAAVRAPANMGLATAILDHFEGQSSRSHRT